MPKTPDLDVNQLSQWVEKLKPEDVFALSADDRFSPKEKHFLYSMATNIRKGYKLSSKQASYLHSIITDAENEHIDSEFHSTEAFLRTSGANQAPAKHVCIRMAWHDSGWNGNVCRYPEKNSYCVGEHSLLSDRLRRNRKLEVECQKDCAGKSASNPKLGNYVPPCYWSINAFGKSTLNISHENPAEKSFPPIQETLPPYSVFSWPFEMAFVRDDEEERQYGKYFPKQIFEKRILDFHDRIRVGESIAFLYCKFSNPVSGEDGEYLLVGAAVVREKGEPHWFDVTPEQLEKAQSMRGRQNFPTLNWALRYSLDFEKTGVRLPYQEYLDLMSEEGIAEEYLDEIKVTVTEPELEEGFSFVAKHVDEDQAIYLLMKLRQSLLEVKRHGVAKSFDVSDQLAKIDILLKHAWEARGYFPGLRNLLLAILARNSADSNDIDSFLAEFKSSDDPKVVGLKALLEGASGKHEALLGDLLDKLDSFQLSVEDFMRLSSLNLTIQQFRRTFQGDDLDFTAAQAAENPYLFCEVYEPQEVTLDRQSGEKLDSEIDLFKIDIALFPHRKFLARDSSFHSWTTADKRRVRAVICDILRRLESRGHCYETASTLEGAVEKYPLFYQLGEDYRTNLNYSDLPVAYRTHFEGRVVISKVSDQTAYYLKEVYDDERFIVHTIESLIAAEDNNAPDATSLLEKAKGAAKGLASKMKGRLDVDLFVRERQRLSNIIPKRKFSLLTGAPGSGKSHELLEMVNYFKANNETYLIVSLTGKAVLRLKHNEQGIQKVNAKTIDKHLMDMKASRGVTTIIHNLIIEESSMVDLCKFAELLRSVNTSSKHFKRLILVGDENQLPPIGFGKPFADIIESMRTDALLADRHHVALSTNCRAELPEEFIQFTKVFSNESKMGDSIVNNAVTDGRYGGLELQLWESQDDLYQRIEQRFREMSNCGDNLAKGLDSLLGLDQKEKTPVGLERFQIVTPYRTGFYGASGLNLLFQTQYRGDRELFKSGEELLLKVGDKLMHTTNEYRDNDLVVANGTFGYASSMGKVFFIGKDEPMSIGSLRNPRGMELAYAITIHKSQGSGFEELFVVLPEKFGFLSRELIFTALTRAKKKIVFFIQANAKEGATSFLQKISQTSSIVGIRSSLALGKAKEFCYVPEPGIKVKSRVEYIIHKKLQAAMASRKDFTFAYEQKYELPKKNFNFHPDFTIQTPDGRTVYWEHLGKVFDPSYLKMWDQRRAIYEEMGDFGKVFTTDEVKGINDSKIDAIISGILDGTMKSEDEAMRYSRLHASLA